jgi:hypothetical protein
MHLELFWEVFLAVGGSQLACIGILVNPAASTDSIPLFVI